MSIEPLVQVKCLKHTYPDQTTVDLCGLDFSVNPGQRVAILGPNGSGKTTLLYHILGLLVPLDGSVSVFGLNPARHFKQIRHRVGVVLQDVDEQVIGPTVWDDVLFGLKNAGLRGQELQKAGEEALDRFGIGHLRNRVPHYLSGGERRKVALAGALANRPELVILDEPFAGLDPSSREELVGTLNDLNRRDGVAFVMALHEVELVPGLADYVYVVTRGGIALEGLPQDVFRQADELRRNHLDVPAIVELFLQLQSRQWPVNVPLSIEDALRQLEAVYKKIG